MPMPIPAQQDIRPIVERLRNSVKIRTKDKTVLSSKVGTTAMKPEQVAENIETIVKRIESVLDQGPLNVRSIFVKTTMGPAVRLE
jgi:large subunit ribosomal protein L1